MKKYFVLGIISLFAVAANAQEIFQKGTTVLNLGVGVGSHIPVEASFEHGIVDGLIKRENGSIGIGGYVGWYNRNSFGLGVRGAFHYQFVDKLDTYAGLMLGYDIHGGTSASSLFPSAFAGARYYFVPSLAVYSELGYGISYLSVGLALKF